MTNERDGRIYRVGDLEMSSNAEASRVARLWGLHVRVLNGDGGPVLSPLPQTTSKVREQWWWNGAAWERVRYPR